MDAIRFLEHAGREVMSPGDYASAVAELDISEPQREALRAGDHAALVDLLGAQSSMFFGIFAPEEQPMREEPSEDNPDEPREPDEQG